MTEKEAIFKREQIIQEKPKEAKKVKKEKVIEDVVKEEDLEA